MLAFRYYNFNIIDEDEILTNFPPERVHRKCLYILFSIPEVKEHILGVIDFPAP